LSFRLHRLERGLQLLETASTWMSSCGPGRGGAAFASRYTICSQRSM
jgi:hypothetical protein